MHMAMVLNGGVRLYAQTVLVVALLTTTRAFC